MEDKRMTIAITGASGFIGARLVALLRSREQETHVRELSRRDLSGSPPPDSYRSVIHCAFDFNAMQANLPLATAVARLCVANQARMVHISTAAVHEPFPDGILRESDDPGIGGSRYKQVKLAIENELTRHVREFGLDLVILRPTIVYGPQGRAWTDTPVRELLTGNVELPDDGLGLCNAVYIDDVCQAAIAALSAPASSGEHFLISGPAPVAWREFYAAYQVILGVGIIQSMTSAGQTQITDDEPSRSRIKKIVARILGVNRMTRVTVAARILKSLVLGFGTHTPAGAKLALFRSRCEIDIGKARTLLGYNPQFDLRSGMAMTAPYIARTYGNMARLRASRMTPRPAVTPAGAIPPRPFR